MWCGSEVSVICFQYPYDITWTDKQRSHAMVFIRHANLMCPNTHYRISHLEVGSCSTSTHTCMHTHVQHKHTHTHASSHNQCTIKGNHANPHLHPSCSSCHTCSTPSSTLSAPLSHCSSTLPAEDVTNSAGQTVVLKFFNYE